MNLSTLKLSFDDAIYKRYKRCYIGPSMIFKSFKRQHDVQLETAHNDVAPKKERKKLNENYYLLFSCYFLHLHRYSSFQCRITLWIMDSINFYELKNQQLNGANELKCWWWIKCFSSLYLSFLFDPKQTFNLFDLFIWFNLLFELFKEEQPLQFISMKRERV